MSHPASEGATLEEAAGEALAMALLAVAGAMAGEAAVTAAESTLCVGDELISLSRCENDVGHFENPSFG